MPASETAQAGALAETFALAVCRMPTIGYLVGRWQDEKEYEDPEEYLAKLREVVPDGVILTKFLRRPFGCRFTAGGETFDLKIPVSGRARLCRVTR